MWCNLGMAHGCSNPLTVDKCWMHWMGIVLQQSGKQWWQKDDQVMSTDLTPILSDTMQNGEDETFLLSTAISFPGLLAPVDFDTEPNKSKPLLCKYKVTSFSGSRDGNVTVVEERPVSNELVHLQFVGMCTSWRTDSQNQARLTFDTSYLIAHSFATSSEAEFDVLNPCCSCSDGWRRI